MKKIFLILSLVALVACSGQQRGAGSDSQSDDTHVTIQYARNFSLVDTIPGVQLLTIQNPESHHGGLYQFALIHQGADESALPQGYQPVHLPVTNFICMTSLQLSDFIALGITDYVKGITSTRHLFNQQMQDQLKGGQTAQIGIEGNFDNEVIIAINPQLILISPSKRGGYDVLAESGLPLMPHMGYQEPDPLGQAEWIKLIGILTGHEREANAQFDSIASRYNELRDRVASQPNLERPTIMSGDMKGGNWYATGGRSYLARIFRDAGARYFMDDNQDTGGVNLDFETVYAQGADAQYWRVSNSFDGQFTYDALAQEDARFADFRAFRDHHVIYCNMSQTPFYESFPVHPDEVLADFISVFHPELLPDHKPVYYSLLR